MAAVCLYMGVYVCVVFFLFLSRALRIVPLPILVDSVSEVVVSRAAEGSCGFQCLLYGNVTMGIVCVCFILELFTQEGRQRQRCLRS